MPNYDQAHQFYAGVDLHARSMFVHVVTAKGKTVFGGVARNAVRWRGGLHVVSDDTGNR